MEPSTLFLLLIAAVAVGAGGIVAVDALRTQKAIHEARRQARATRGESMAALGFLETYELNTEAWTRPARSHPSEPYTPVVWIDWRQGVKLDPDTQQWYAAYLRWAEDWPLPGSPWQEVRVDGPQFPEPYLAAVFADVEGWPASRELKL